MKSDELVRRINNGEIKVGTEIIIYLDGEEAERAIYKGKNIGLEYKNNKVPVNNFVLLNNDIEFEIVEEHKGWFKPKCGEFYFVINAFGGINFSKWANSETDLYAYNHHNCFKTEKEAQKYLDYKNALKEAEKPFKYDEYNCLIRLNRANNLLYVDWNNSYQSQGVTYLGQDEDAVQAFIEKWEKQILKYEFGIFE